MEWKKVINADLKFAVLTKVNPTKGNLVYEYNPFRNYRLSKNMYEYKNYYYSQEELKAFGIVRALFTDNNGNYWEDISSFEASEFYQNLENQNNLNLYKIDQWILEGENISNDITLYEKGELVNFITDELSFSLEHPVHIIPQYSYDGSVNLIINDGNNIPRLINSRFSATGRNTYEVIDRKGNNDTNIYDQGDQFNIDTSLYKRIIEIPEVKFMGVGYGGNLKIGNYHFYFKYSDADGNETDFVEESGLVSIFIGTPGPFSSHTGSKDQNSYKSAKFVLSNIDSSYDYITVYYSRSTAEFNSITEYVKINKKYLVGKNKEADINITGFEDSTFINASDINLSYNIVDSVVTSATCLNMLFLANVHKSDIPYDKLLQLALRFLPYVKEVHYPLEIDKDYNIQSLENGYYDPQYIYNKVGYWNKEIYRFGIVFILPNNELTPVFNIRGRHEVLPFNETSSNIQGKFNDGQYSHFNLKREDNSDIIININDSTLYIIPPEEGEGVPALNPLYENAKGVVTFKPTKDVDTIYALDIRTDDDTIQELKNYVKGYFFVRQKRIPTILALGITIGLDKASYTPTIPTCEGFLHEMADSLGPSTYVETEDINDVNYISEGFLSRYKFDLKPKSSAIWKKIGTAVAISAIIAAAVVGSVFTAGVSLAGGVAAVAATIGTSTTAVIGAAVAETVIIASLVGAAVGATMAAAGAANEFIYGVSRAVQSKKLNGRNTEIPVGLERKELDLSRVITHEFRDRIIIKDGTKNDIKAIICPDYEVNLPYYNSIFTGSNFTIESTMMLGINELSGYSSNYFSNDENHFYIPSYYDSKSTYSVHTKIVGVPDNVKLVGIESLKFRSRAGESEEAFRYELVGVKFEETKDKKINSDIIRGSFGPYLGISEYKNYPCLLVNIMIPEYDYGLMLNYFKIRMNDSTLFYSISKRYSISNSDNELINKLKGFSINNISTENRSDGYAYELYRGDCYLCLFTHRVNRNFNDPSAPYNDDIVDENTWKNNYDPDNLEKYNEINLGDVNAVKLGMWVTFKLRSSNNLNIRTLDGSMVDEDAMVGHSRGYFPYYPMNTEGTYKHPDSYIYNRGFATSLSEKWNFELPDVPHIKNWFGTRIMYSDIHVNDAYKNGYRVFLGNHYRDYTRSYGEVVKLVELNSNLLCVFEHGIALIPVNERAVAGEGAGGNVYINTSNVLPENPLIISDMFGSLWAESVLKTPGNTKLYVYGVDTVAKKIWRTDGRSLLCISDFKVQSFLNNNITLGERELTPKIGIRNVKTVYNAFKHDVMFTFYDNTYGFEEKVWNLCWNELLEKFITFYSWVPSYMENINNIPFSFNRDTSKWIAKLGVSHAENSFADGITLSNVIIDNKPDGNYKLNYLKKDGSEGIYETQFEVGNRFIGFLSLSNRIVPNSFYDISFSLVRDQYSNYKLFEIINIGTIEIPEDGLYSGLNQTVYGLYLKENVQINDLLSELYYRNSAGHSYADYEANMIAPIDGQIKQDLPIFKDITGKRRMLPKELLINSDRLVRLLNIKAEISIINHSVNTSLTDAYYNMKASYVSNTLLVDAGRYESVVAVVPSWNILFLNTDFWKHGLAGIIDIADDIYPTYWYGKQHPFEFEFIVVNDPSVHKVFTNLEIIANKAKPESFHYEVVGEVYDFAKDKVNMYFRLEALKALWQYNGADITYDRNFLKVLPKLQPKSADLIHTYYSRQDTINEIEDYYISTTYLKGYDYRHLSGGEIVYYPDRLEYRVWNHTKAVDINDLSSEDSRSIIAANCQYLEDKWRVTINPILICYKNEYSPSELKPLIRKENSTWTYAANGATLLPNLPIYNSPIPNMVLEKGNIDFPGIHSDEDTSNALYGLYNISEFETNYKPLDITNWLDDVNIYKYSAAQNRKETDVRDRFVKIRIRYSGEELAIINFINTIYRVSYS